MIEGVFWRVEHIIIQYWGWLLGYTIPLLVGFYIVHWRERQGKPPQGGAITCYMACLVWPVILLIMVIFIIAMLFREAAICGTSWIDSLILIILRRKIHFDETGELWRSSAPNAELYAQWVKVKDKTGVHWIQVPLSIKTARDGVAWTYGLKEDEYHPTVRS